MAEREADVPGRSILMEDGPFVAEEFREIQVSPVEAVSLLRDVEGAVHVFQEQFNASGSQPGRRGVD